MIDKSLLSHQFGRIENMIQSQNKKPVFTNGNYMYELDEVMYAIKELERKVLSDFVPVWHSRREMPNEALKARTGDDGQIFFPIVCLIQNEEKKRCITTLAFKPNDSPNLQWLDFYMEHNIMKWAYFNDIAPEVKDE